MIITHNDSFLFLDDCQYSEWSTWSSCSLTCGMGSAIQRREIEVEGKGDGILCDSEAMYNEKNCDIGECPATTPIPFNSR